MDALIAPLTHRPACSQQAIHGADRAQEAVFIEQRGVDLVRCAIDKAITHQFADHQVLLGIAELERWRACADHAQPR